MIKLSDIAVIFEDHNDLSMDLKEMFFVDMKVSMRNVLNNMSFDGTPVMDSLDEWNYYGTRPVFSVSDGKLSVQLEGIIDPYSEDEEC